MTSSIVSTITDCRLCNSNDLVDAIMLGDQVITSRFPTYGDFSTPKIPVNLCMCRQCGLLQLKETPLASELYEYEYGYRSGINNTMRNHLLKYQEEVVSKLSQPLQSGDVVVDIGSNDATTLRYYPESCRRIGIDPTGNQFIQYYAHRVPVEGQDATKLENAPIELLPTYFTVENFREVFGDIKCKIVSSIAMFYDLPDPVKFATDINAILESDGLWTCEQSYLLDMLRSNSIDTICHEHLEYYTLKQIKEIADRSNFKIIDVKFNSSNGGSFRIYLAKCQSLAYRENTELLNKILQDELDYGAGLSTTEIFDNFVTRCQTQVQRLCDFIDTVNQNDKEMYIYGASTKGNCLLQYANLGPTKIKYAVERNLNKVGKMTSTGIEIISEEKMRAAPPEYLLVLPWHFRNEIVDREKDYLQAGGQLVFPFPNFEIVGYTPKVLITGCDGFIAQYVRQTFSDYTLYGIARNSAPVLLTSQTAQRDRHSITKFCVDMNNTFMLEHVLMMIQPDILIHLAGISSSQYAHDNVVETLRTNGLVTASLCEIIHQNKLSVKLFNASSSEIYKGHVNYVVNENDNFMHHLSPYSIAKIMGHSIVDFYRNAHQLSFSNGVIFTTESSKKRIEFLLNKVASHAKRWKVGHQEVLRLGNLDSYRNIIHPADVANAIKYIVSQPQGDSYLICNTDASVKVSDLVIRLYSKCGITLVASDDNGFRDLETDQLVVEISNNTGRTADGVVTNIQAQPFKLLNLGWSPRHTTDDILREVAGVE